MVLNFFTAKNLGRSSGENPGLPRHSSLGRLLGPQIEIRNAVLEGAQTTQSHTKPHLLINPLPGPSIFKSNVFLS